MKKTILLRAPLQTASGYGVHSRQIYRALKKSELFDIALDSINWGRTAFRLNDDISQDVVDSSRKYLMLQRQGQFNPAASVQVTIPNEFMRITQFDIGVTAGIETTVVSPQWIEKANSAVDLLVVPSKHSQYVYQETQYHDHNNSFLKLEKECILVHEGVNTSIYNTNGVYSSRFNIPNCFNFLFVGLGLDKGPGEDRKNVHNLIMWFCEAFKDRKDVGLVLKLSLVNASNLDREMTLSKIKELKRNVGAGEFPRITLVHGNLSDEDMAALYKHPNINCFVTLTHGEGFGLPILEAAACGLPVIATNWSGHLDFLSIDGKKKFIPLDYDLNQIPEAAAWENIVEKHSMWACVRREDFVKKSLKLVQDNAIPRQWATELAGHIKNNFDEEKVYQPLIERLDASTSSVSISVPRNQSVDKKSYIEESIKRLNEVKDKFDKLAGGKKSLLYTMPMSAGDVYLSTAVVNSLRKKYTDHFIFFATSQQYASILDGNTDIDMVIPFDPAWMMDVQTMEKIFDVVMTPNLSVQLTTSNWIRKGKGRNLSDEFAHQCGVNVGQSFIELKCPEEFDLEHHDYIVLHTGNGKDQWSARNYKKWQSIISNINEADPSLTIVHVGSDDEKKYVGTLDFVGKTKNHNELAYVVSHALAVMSIDSFVMHIAGAFSVPCVALFGSSYPTSTGINQLIYDRSNFSSRGQHFILLEPPTRYTCEGACYKNECIVDSDYPCINDILPETVFNNLSLVLSNRNDKLKTHKFVDKRPTISGYCHVFNAIDGNYPFVQSIKSMLGFCDEVVVVDGGSTDGTKEKLESIFGDKIKLFVNEWDWDVPEMDGAQKAYGRAMCSGDFLWQMDVDEIVHENDYEKIRKLVDRFPDDELILDLPVIELWGDDKTCRTDRHAWKWRLSRNDFRVTHGINKYARVYDEKTGKTFAKKGQSDGCEYIDIITGEYCQHKNFYTQEFERERLYDKKAYASRMNKTFSELPSVWHYSWCDIERKITSFKKFWNKTWSNLYNDPAPEDRFPDVNTADEIKNFAEVMKQRGGEHGNAETFKLELDPPAVMKEVA